MVPACVPGIIGKMGLSMVMALALAGCDGDSGSAGQPARVAVTGTIDIEAGTRVDADSADALDALLQRLPLTTAQRLPAEFIIAGYVSDTPQTADYPSPPGAAAFQYFRDQKDQFVSPLQSGLELTIQSFATRLETVSDLQLTVSAPDGEVLADPVVPGDGSTIVVPLNSEQTGDYSVSVISLGSAPMLYILSSARTETSVANAYDWPKHEFVEDEAIISLRAQGNAVARPSGLPTSALMAPGRQIAPGLWTVRRPSAVHASGNGSPADETLAWIRRLRDDPVIRHVSPNYKTHALVSPVNEPLYSNNVLGQQWHYSLINGPIAWQLAPGGGEGVNVAVLDSGLFRSGGQWHSDLAANVTVGFDAVDGDNIPADPGNTGGLSSYHGTHVAGTVAAAVNGSGGAGVAFNANLMPVRVLTEGNGSLTDLLEGMQWVLGDSSESRPPAEIVNLSLGGLPCGDPGVAGTLQQLINQGIANGIVYVAAAGNSGTSQPFCPAALENVFSVSAVDGAGRLTDYSSFGSTIDLAAPGGDPGIDGNGDGQGDVVSSTSAAVVSGQLQPVYRGLSGTSMAAPHVSGVMALMKEARPTLSSSDIEGYLRNGDLTQPPCDEGCSRTDQLGYGVLDAAKAVQAVLSGTPPQLLTSSPVVVNLTTEANVPVTRPVKLSPLGNYDITITDVSVSDDWFTASVLPQNTISADAPAQLELALVPNNLEAGISARGNLQITYDSGTASQAILTVPVIGRKNTDQQARNAGRHFVLLVRPEPVGESFETVAQTVATARNGQYQFEFIPDDGEEPQLQNEVQPGEYILIAGTDLDNDGLICHSGEACAEYPVSGLRQVISVQENQPVTGLQMTTSYSRPTVSASSPDLLPRPDFEGYRLLPEQAPRPSDRFRAIRSR